MGAAREARGDLAGAVAALKTAARLDPNSALTHNTLGLVLRTSGDTAGAHAAFKKATRTQVGLLALGTLIMLAVGSVAPVSFMSHFVVFALSCFVGFQVIWNVSHSLHTPLMAVTNAISSIIILGALMQIGSGNFLVILLAGLSVFMAGINIFGGFIVTQRMLQMYRRKGE